MTKRHITLILILFSNLIFAQTSTETNLDKTSDVINHQSLQNNIVVEPINISPYDNTVVTSKKSIVISNSESDSSINTNEIFIEPINVIPINQVSSKSNKSISISNANAVGEKPNIIIVPSIKLEKYIGQNSKKAIKNK